MALFALEGTICYCLARELGSSRLVFTIQEGDTMQLHASAAGRVLMAYGPDDFHKTVLDTEPLEKFTPLTMTDPKKIRTELVAIKKRGYSINKGERELEIAAIAAPIFSHDHTVNASLAIVGPEQRFTEDKVSAMKNALLDSTGRISELIGGSQYR